MTQVGANLDKAIYFGGFPVPESWAERWGIPTMPMEWVAVPVLRFMKWLYAITGNYGVAIIVLTIVTKLLFFPLSLKSMKSMKAMQAIQPQVNALRSKYKSDPQRLQRETMDLYRQNKVNPLGGCLPMVVQVPVFYALYVSLTVSPDLQNSPFICFGRAPDWMPLLGSLDLWICDLAAYDPTYILPILMGVSMFVQQKMMPVMGDPRQAKMMLMMPVIFTFMFLSLPSGLVLYWTLSNVLQIGQQYYMDRGRPDASADQHRPGPPTGRPDPAGPASLSPCPDSAGSGRQVELVSRAGGHRGARPRGRRSEQLSPRSCPASTATCTCSSDGAGCTTWWEWTSLCGLSGRFSWSRSFSLR